MGGVPHNVARGPGSVTVYMYSAYVYPYAAEGTEVDSHETAINGDQNTI